MSSPTPALTFSRLHAQLAAAKSRRETMREMAICLATLPARAGSPAAAQTADRGARNVIETRTFSAADDQRILKAFEGLRVADVTDGMDFVGLQNVGLMDPEIHALWKDTEKFSHRFIGIA